MTVAREESALTQEAVRVLRILLRPDPKKRLGRVEARRTFPFPHKYWLVNPEGHRYAEPLTADTVASLVGLQLIEVTIHDPAYDTFDYAPTSAAAGALERLGAA